ncbi:hypothetical protein VNO77_31119 [Canavalia gladiata]|uniref:Uncharacterized protein n=1 Tax=Canavalia gladiata TaxID=3824 RepID=A0AAN9KNN3_CANGL
MNEHTLVPESYGYAFGILSNTVRAFSTPCDSSYSFQSSLLVHDLLIAAETVYVHPFLLFPEISDKNGLGRRILLLISQGVLYLVLSQYHEQILALTLPLHENWRSNKVILQKYNAAKKTISRWRIETMHENQKSFFKGS